MPNGTSPQILVDGLHLPEGSRWRTTAPGEDKLWFVDILAGKVIAVDLSGSVETIAEVNVPVGLGFTTDGTLLVTSPPKASCWPYATARRVAGYRLDNNNKRFIRHDAVCAKPSPGAQSSSDDSPSISTVA